MSILVAGIGNIFLGDDAFGVEVVRRLAPYRLPEGVRVVDFGIRGIDLTYAIMEQWDAVILIDAVSRGMAPGTVYTLETQTSDTPAEADPSAGPPIMDMHNLDPERVLRLAKSLGGNVSHVFLVGCEPTPIDPENDFQMVLSAPVAAAVDVAAKTVVSLVDTLLNHQLPLPGGINQPEGVALCHD